MIVGTGIDIEDIGSIRKQLDEPISVFKEKVFSQTEQEYCESHKGHDPALHYAGRFAAKEAFIKAIGPLVESLPQFKTSVMDINFAEIEIALRDFTGPFFNLKGKAAELFKTLGDSGRKIKIHLSISHQKEYAVANVIVEQL